MPTAAVQNVRLVIAAANARGVPPSKLIAAAGLDPQALLDADGRLPLEAALRSWQIASELSGDPWFGLSAALHLRPDAFGLLGFAIHASATVGEGLRRLARYFHVVNQNVSLELAVDGALARVRVLAEHEGATVEELRHPVECLVAALLLVARRATGRSLAPAAVSFRHAAPADLAAYLRTFGIAPRFGQPVTELALARETLDLPHVAPDGGMIAVAERHLRRLLEELPRTDTIADRVRRVLVEELRLGEPTLARVAARLRTSERTLQRRLGQEGTSLQALLDELRRDLSLRHLAESTESIAEISFLLGFAEVRAFHRAFKRWTGSTPAAYRQARGAGAPAGAAAT
jgi:AraC-like DNA-binding protein